MKHNLKVTIFLLVFFFIAQIIGLSLLSLSMEVREEEGITKVNYKETALGERPDFTPETSFVSIIIAVAIGTALALILIKFKMLMLWKFWFFLAVFLSISVSLGTLFPKILAFAFGLTLALLKIFKPNIITHNLSELLIYPGIAIIFVPMLNIKYMFFLLIVISAYDMYAVWKSKHMVKMAKFQSKTGTFAGLLIPYKTSRKTKKKGKKKGKKTKVKTAILGGGDVAFPLLFAGTVMGNLVLIGFDKYTAFTKTLPIVIFATISLALLFFKGKASRYYPAMPFLSLGCLVGYLFVL